MAAADCRAGLPVVAAAACRGFPEPPEGFQSLAFTRFGRCSPPGLPRASQKLSEPRVYPCLAAAAFRGCPEPRVRFWPLQPRGDPRAPPGPPGALPEPLGCSGSSVECQMIGETRAGGFETTAENARPVNATRPCPKNRLDPKVKARALSRQRWARAEHQRGGHPKDTPERQRADDACEDAWDAKQVGTALSVIAPSHPERV